MFHKIKLKTTYVVTFEVDGQRIIIIIIIIIVTSFAPISSKIKLSGATKPGD